MDLSTYRLLLVFALICGWAASLAAVNSYTVRFEGDLNSDMQQLLRASSHLITLEKNPPATAAALRRRAEGDIPRLVRALQSLAYYDVHIELRIDLDAMPMAVIFEVRPRARFTLAEFSILPSLGSSPAVYKTFTLDDLDISIGEPAYPKTILDAEENLLKTMANRGYPLAKIVDRRVEADLTDKTIHVELSLDTGPFACFGPTTLSGNCKVSPAFFTKKIAWQRGEPFHPYLLERTQRAMEASALFSSIAIIPAENLDDDGTLPIRLDVVESKHRSLACGVGYSTLRYFGGVVEYENRNMREMGERLTLRTALWWNSYDGTLFYLIPDWYYRERDLLFLLKAYHESTKGYDEFSQSASIAIEQQVNSRLRCSYGIMGEFLRNTRSDNDGDFNLVKLPVTLKWTSVDDITDPKYGYSLYYRGVPTLQLLHNRFAYCINTLIMTAYQPLDANNRWILAFKCTLGCILGAKKRTIPPSERFYAGSEETLRGYRYHTVSPLDHHDNPRGGRSMMVYSLECRWRMSADIGWVFFWDIGNVYDAYVPQLYRRQLQAIGLGIRYHTPVGPLRLDVAFPLQPRRHIDRRFEIYLSMGQSF